jgi:putative oxidoreductase
MNTMHKVEAWADTHHPAWIDVIRFGLGVFLIVKGLAFAGNLDGLIGRINFTEAYAAGGIAHFIIMAHVMGGLLIAIGLLTRIAVACQIPILLGAVIFAGTSANYNYGELWQALIVLALVVVCFIYGSGKWSADQWLRKHPGQ